MSTALMTRALVGNTSFLEVGIGFEPVARATRLILSEHLNTEIARQAERWNAADSALQGLGMDPGVGQVDITAIPAGNFHEGPHKSLIEEQVTAFPNVSVMSYMATKSTSQAYDQASSSDLTMAIETMAISGPVPEGLDLAHETIVHRRIQRMTEAVVIVIGAHPTLLGTIHAIQDPPRGGIVNSTWLRRADSNRYVWQASRLQYTVQRHNLIPDPVF